MIGYSWHSCSHSLSTFGPATTFGRFNRCRCGRCYGCRWRSLRWRSLLGNRCRLTAHGRCHRGFISRRFWLTPAFARFGSNRRGRRYDCRWLLVDRRGGSSRGSFKRFGTATTFACLTSRRRGFNRRCNRCRKILLRCTFARVRSNVARRSLFRRALTRGALCRHRLCGGRIFRHRRRNRLRDSALFSGSHGRRIMRCRASFTGCLFRGAPSARCLIGGHCCSLSSIAATYRLCRICHCSLPIAWWASNNTLN